jgi:hypothetical protein
LIEWAKENDGIPDPPVEPSTEIDLEKIRDQVAIAIDALNTIADETK